MSNSRFGVKLVCGFVGLCSMYDTESVMIALGITAAVCVSISLFAIQTKVGRQLSV